MGDITDHGKQTHGQAVVEVGDDPRLAVMVWTVVVLVAGLWYLGLGKLGLYFGVVWSLWPLTSLTVQSLLFIGWLTAIGTERPLIGGITIDSGSAVHLRCHSDSLASGQTMAKRAFRTLTRRLHDR